MSNPPKKPLEPLTTLKGVGHARRKNAEEARAPSDGEKALLALDKMMTDSMRRDGLLPPLPSEPVAPPAPATAPLPDIADYDAMQMPVWTLVMALAWIATKSVETVIWQRNDWRRAHSWPRASVPTSIDPDLDDGEPHPAFYSSSAAMSDLKSKGEAGELEVRAMSVSRNQPVVLTPLDWSYGTLQFNRHFDEVWVVGQEEYVRLTIQRDKLLDAFPLNSDTAVQTLPVAGAPTPRDDHGPQGLGPTVQILADAIWSKWRMIPGGFPRKEDRFRAIWAAARVRQPALGEKQMPSFDSFERAEKAIREYLKNQAE